MWVVTIDRQPTLSSSSRMARPSAAPSAGSVPAPSSSSKTSECCVASPRSCEIRRTCDENVESDCSRLCSSPISASTWSKTGSCEPSAAGTCRPLCAMIASKPTVLSATVFPPVFGPVTTMIWNCTPRWTSIGTTERTGSTPVVVAATRAGSAAGRETSFVVHVRGRHPVIHAVPGPGMDQVQLGHDRQGLEQRVRHHADLGAEPAQDPTDLLCLAGTEIRELSRLFRDRGRLDVDRLVGGTAALNRALELAPMVLGHGQDVMVADHREVGVTEDPLDLG